MKNSILVLLILVVINFGYGQSKQKVKSHELGIDATELLEKLVLNEGDFSNNDYFLLYKYNFKNIALRTRIGGNFYSYSRGGETNTNPSNRKSKQGEIKVAMGIDKSSKIKEKWKYNYGIEGILHYEHWLHTNVGTQNENPEIIENTIRYGLGLILGIQYSIKPWISIASEASLQLLKGRNTERYEFMNEANNIDGYRNDFNISYNPTNGIFLKIHF